MSKPKKTSKDVDLNDFIRKSHIRAVEKFNEELKAFARETGEKEVTLYENANTSFTLSEPFVENGWLKFNYDGQPDSVRMVEKDDLDGKYYEEEGVDSIMEYVKFWRKCLNRAKRYWGMDPDRLDAIQDGEIEEDEDEEED